MTLICKPPGPGNWNTITVTIDRPADLFRVHVGMVFEVPGYRLRICEIRP